MDGSAGYSRRESGARAVGVAGLRGGGEEEDGLRVLVLHAREVLHPLLAGVELLLARRVRVEVLADLLDGVLQREGVLGRGGGLELLAVVGGEHAHRREDQAVERVVADVAVHLPVNELLNDVRRRLEREDEARHLDVLQLRLERRVLLGPLVERVQVDRGEARLRLRSLVRGGVNDGVDDGLRRRDRDLLLHADHRRPRRAEQPRPEVEGGGERGEDGQHTENM